MSAALVARSGKDGREWTLSDAPIGQGGAGRVYRHPVHLDQCFKIYNDARTAQQHEAKVRAMIGNTPEAVFTEARDGRKVVQMAWPLDILTGPQGFIGFSMPFIDFNRSLSLPQVIEPPLRKRKGVPSHLHYRVRIARNLAVVLKALHQKGHRMIDLKPDNIRVYRWTPTDPQPDSSFVALLDCDGFAVAASAGAALLPAKLATPELSLPRALQVDGGIDIAYLNANAVAQDLWALAAVTFRLLNDGLSPFDGVPRPGAEASFPRDERERARQLTTATYAFAQQSAGALVLPPPGSLHAAMRPTLRTLFDDTFLQRGGVGIDDWIDELDQLLKPGQACDRDPTHWRLGETCGQCARAEAQKLRPKPMLVRPSPSGPGATAKLPRATSGGTAPAAITLPRATPGAATAAQSKTWPLPAERPDRQGAIRASTLLGLVTGAVTALALWAASQSVDTEAWRTAAFGLFGIAPLLTWLAFDRAPRRMVPGRDTFDRQIAAFGLGLMGHLAMAGFALAAGVFGLTVLQAATQTAAPAVAATTVSPGTQGPAAELAAAATSPYRPVEGLTPRLDRLAVRMGPSPLQTQIGTVLAGELLDVDGRVVVSGQAWLRVRLGSGQVGFLLEQNTEPLRDWQRAQGPQNRLSVSGQP